MFLLFDVLRKCKGNWTFLLNASPLLVLIKAASKHTFHWFSIRHIMSICCNWTFSRRSNLVLKNVQESYVSTNNAKEEWGFAKSWVFDAKYSTSVLVFWLLIPFWWVHSDQATSSQQGPLSGNWGLIALFCSIFYKVTFLRIAHTVLSVLHCTEFLMYI